jgi:hypothetical protein
MKLAIAVLRVPIRNSRGWCCNTWRLKDCFLLPVRRYLRGWLLSDRLTLFEGSDSITLLGNRFVSRFSAAAHSVAKLRKERWWWW